MSMHSDDTDVTPGNADVGITFILEVPEDENLCPPIDTAELHGGGWGGNNENGSPKNIIGPDLPYLQVVIVDGKGY